ncbi:MAG: phosphate starvation-inducible protein [Desulfovibrionaceae bacterium]|nr:MAG: phosphate starvation-inducible protein [Desulfovibrionaceae bacterium]
MAKNNGLERKLEFDDASMARDLFGPHNANLAFVGEKTGIRADSRGSVLTLRGDSQEVLDQVAEAMIKLYGMLKRGVPVYPRDIEPVLSHLGKTPGAKLGKFFEEQSFVASPKKTISPRTFTQREYMGAIRSGDMVFGIGPAGTGKTYLAVAMTCWPGGSNAWC